ncbi:hypothetical protein RN96_11490 [Fusobacterium polymorphum]|uniref:Polysaccharide chain length determinant N-terminal domain-containing protein n=1 Tax=Fusobacterium nucleatum subsp. polymorphum TaxID=76857 RepID=A0A2B7YG77_FUSNP|nr:hypothetical protein [Fusobacterium polymorphum]PGH20190.1 hypothetical protein RN96_11490 [Fusobacterium polymorphum]
MKNNLVEVENNFQEEDINLYDIIDIFLKNIRIFIIVSIIGIIITCLYIGKRIIFDKNNILTIEYSLNYEELESYLNGKVYYPRKNPNQILLDNKYLDELFENEDLKKYYEENINENKDNPNTKRQFIIEKKLLEDVQKQVETIDGKNTIVPNSYKVTVMVNKRSDIDKKLSLSIMNTYLKIIKEFYNETIFKYIEDRKIYSDERLPILKNLLNENAVVGNTLSFDKNSITENNFLRYIYPVKVSNVDTYYPEYIKLESENQAITTLTNLGFNNIDNFIQYDTSIIIEKEKAGNFIRLGIGTLISLFLGILAIIIKSLKENYKEKKFYKN